MIRFKLDGIRPSYTILIRSVMLVKFEWGRNAEIV